MRLVRKAIVVFFLLFVYQIWSCQGRIFSFKMHNRFSDPVKKWSAAAGKLSPALEKGSFAKLADCDRLLYGNKIFEINQLLGFSDGNFTFQISSLGLIVCLRYTMVELGTPGTKFMMGLDTQSDLFWGLYDCSQCGPIEGTTYASRMFCTC